MLRRAALTLVLSLLGTQALAESTTPVTAVSSTGGTKAAKMEPFRTFVTIQRYVIENNGEPNNPVSNVRITVTFPNGSKIELPDGKQWWPVGNGQAQEINRTFEIPWAFVSNKDGFKFAIQMERKGSTMLPCEFDVNQLSQFNRAYNCQTDVAWQTQQKVTSDKIDKEGVQLRIFTSKNSLPKEIPVYAIALK